jgi:GAF domain-containing protein
MEDLIGKTKDPIARMATIAALLSGKMSGFYWTGFYILKDGELIVGPYQGPLACQILEKGKGVCWASINRKKSIIVPDVSKFPGHIACDPRTKSEIAVPVKNHKNEVIAVLDVDSREPDHFDQIDAKHLERIATYVFS